MLSHARIGRDGHRLGEHNFILILTYGLFRLTVWNRRQMGLKVDLVPSTDPDGPVDLSVYPKRLTTWSLIHGPWFKYS